MAMRTEHSVPHFFPADAAVVEIEALFPGVVVARVPHPRFLWLRNFVGKFGVCKGLVLFELWRVAMVYLINLIRAGFI